ncbi:MAG TPA: alpha-1,4-glucan--maltose-1-phosphate maltosyltransferase [Solirubrobacteraceae bacterium]|nr:alpha-1,4-glucan--maltose-1-phosphate maltosyltransferase [Solirubrobacteraceae bacterium]
MPLPASGQPPKRIVIQYPAPSVDGGSFPAKRCAGDLVVVEADVFRDGHDKLRAVVRSRGPGERRWRESELEPIDAHLGGVRWGGEFTVDAIGRWLYTVEAWTDVFGTWRDELERKRAAGQEELAGELSEGAVLLHAALERAEAKGDRALIEHALTTLEDQSTPEPVKHDVVLGAELFEAVERSQERHGSVTLEEPLALEVDRVRARFGAWYELFPRSWGGLAGVREVLPALAGLGFDVVYLPPIHPIGLTNRKGRDNALTAAPGDPGSPWAIGAEEGGHEAVHPELGTLEDVRALTDAAQELGMDIALDFAIQCSADHPWLREHPEWFHHRPDGTLKYAENPPKRYQDIYNVNWDTPDWRALWQALLEIMLQWVELGVKVFRVDNPHTKPFPFWEWLIRQVHARDRDVIFLAEAFTRRGVMRHLAKIGFSQSYTYFTWKNSRWELTEYVTELAYSGEQEYFRPNFFVNTPDILHAYLQHGGRPAFEARLVLAATLSPSYGVYSGYENLERVAVREGSEEYLHSEKFETKERTLEGPLLGMMRTLNEARRANPALQELSNVTFLETANDALIAYAKQSGGNTLITVVNIDPHVAQEGLAVVPAELGLPPVFTVHDILSGSRFQWRIGPNYVRLEPGVRQAHVNLVETL